MNSQRGIKNTQPVLILLRGGPCSGKTTIGRLLRDRMGNTISIAFNVFHRFLSNNPRENKELTFEAVLYLTEFFLQKNFSVIIEELFLIKERVDPFFTLGQKYQVPVYLFELDVSSEEALKRAHLCGMDRFSNDIKRLLARVSLRPDSRATTIDTTKLSAEECANFILKTVSKVQ